METISPTRERLAKSEHWETPENTRETKRATYRTVGVVESMRKRGWLTEEQALAFERFERHARRAAACPSGIGSYVERRGGTESTAIAGPIDRRIYASDHVRMALASIGYPAAELALVQAALEDTSLENIGREIGREGNKVQAITSGKTLLQIGTHRLAVHYGAIQVHPPNA